MVGWGEGGGDGGGDGGGGDGGGDGGEAMVAVRAVAARGAAMVVAAGRW